MSIIKELWFGNVGSSQDIKLTSEVRTMLSKAEVTKQKLYSILNEEQQKVLETLVQELTEADSVERADVYEYAFCIGLAIGYESKRIGEQNETDKSE